MENKLDKLVHGLNLLLLVGSVICLIDYVMPGGWATKGMTSSWFVMIGLVNLRYAIKERISKVTFACVIVIGLILGMLADIMLGKNFILGIVLFALGHIAYLLGFFLRAKPNKFDVICGAPIAVVSVIAVIGTPFIQVDDSILEKMLIGYAVIIAAMLGKAISNYCGDKSVTNKLILIGSAMFWFSDLMLAANMFGNGGRVASWLCSFTYWPGQCILAYALYYYVRERKIKKSEENIYE